MEINPELPRSLARELAAGERVLWAGRPAPLAMAMKSAVPFLFAIPWTAFSIDFMVRWSHHDVASYVFQGSFVAVGVAMLCSPFYAYWSATRTVYAITVRRVLIVTDEGWTRRVQSFTKVDPTHLCRTEGRDGRGTVTFAKELVNDSEGGTRTSDVQFVWIQEPRRVEEILRRVFAESAPA
jgi:hypothetical protein